LLPHNADVVENYMIAAKQEDIAFKEVFFIINPSFRYGFGF